MSSLKFAGVVRGPSDTPLKVHGGGGFTLPCRDLAQAKRFMREVLGGMPAGITLAQQDAAVAAEGRYPHVAFEADLPDALALRERLGRYGVPTALATAGADGLLYFRDPTGSLWKIVSRDAGAALRATTACVDDEQVDVGALAYARWSTPATAIEAQ